MNVKVQGDMQEAFQARSHRTRVTADDVVEGLAKEATLYGQGASHSARVAAWAHLGKHLGMFVDRQEHSGADGGPIEVDHTLLLEKLKRIAQNGVVE